MACLRPVHAGGQGPSFRLVAAPNAGWRLSGEVDIANATDFEVALGATASCGECDLDISGLEFIDASAMGVIARGASRSTICLFGARSIVRRSWKVSGYADEVPAVKFVD